MARREARRTAVDVLYAADVRGVTVPELLELREPDEPLVQGYAKRLTLGVSERRAEIDDLLTRHSPGWPLDRMSAVDRNVLRIAVLELLEGDNPAPVVIDEAVEIAKELSGDEAGRFVNGVLGGVLAETRA